MSHRHKDSLGKWTTSVTDPDYIALEKRVAALEHPVPPPVDPPPPPPPPPPVTTTGIVGTLAGATKNNVEIGRDFGDSAMSFLAPTSALPASVLFSQRGGTGGYSGGTGGTIVMTIEGDSGGKPDGTVYAKATRAFGNPSGGWTTYLRVSYATAQALVPGTKYWARFHNSDPDPMNNWISANVLWTFDDAEQPTLGPLGLGVWIAGKSGHAYVPVIDIAFADGSHAGSGFIECMIAYHREADGTRSVAERFTLAEAHTFTRFGMRVQRVSGSAPALLILEDLNGKALATGSVPSSTIPVGVPGADNSTAKQTWAWATVTANAPAGEYRLCLRTTSGTVYSASPLREGRPPSVPASGTFGSRMFPNGHAEAFDGSKWSAVYDDTTDLQFVLA